MKRRDLLKAITGLTASVASLDALSGGLDKDQAFLERVTKELLPLHVKYGDLVSRAKSLEAVCNSTKLDGVESPDIVQEANELEGWLKIVNTEAPFVPEFIYLHGHVQIGGLTVTDRENHRRRYSERYA